MTLPSLLYQSTRTSSCAISATHNLLALYGQKNDARAVREWFSYDAAARVDHDLLRAVIQSRLPGSRLRWSPTRKLSFDEVKRWTFVACRRGAPLLFTFCIRHKKRPWFGTHCAIALGVGDDGVCLVDSLGRRDRFPNATILPTRRDRGWHIEGAPLIMTNGQGRALLGLPPL